MASEHEPQDELTPQDYIQDLQAKIQFLVDWIDGNGGLGDGGFSFPDGDFWPVTRCDLCGARNFKCDCP